jgi:TolB-like protein/Tfp pilus assembly protein PilF/tRNA A-37 threonylcarbamoyl transferase component Bud32
MAGNEDAAPSLIGRHLGTYEVLALLGAGGMGQVYRARDTKLNRDVALKTLPDAVARDADRLARFRREAQAVAALNHPHIVTIFSIEEQDAVPFMTMELIEGSTLDQGIPAGGLSLARFFDIAIALADALSAAHRKHIIHRDLKPANVMVTDDGNVKVLDFGLARIVDPDVVRLEEAVTSEGLTAAGTIAGTMPYMSPEQIEAKPLDHRTDIFSLGIILYELATGERPFRGDSSAGLISSILRDHPEPVGERRVDLPGGVSRLIGQCLEKPRHARIQTANEVLVELKAQRRAWESGAGATGRAIRDVAPPPVERATSIAVLAFTDMSAEKDQDWFCDGIAEEILNALTPLKGLGVAARTSAFSFKGKGADLRTIGEKLNVTTVLEGSVRRAGNRVRITVQLSDVANGFQLWSERYDRELRDIFDVQDEIAKSVAERLRVTLAGDKDERLVEQPTTNIEAYQLYLQGRALLGRRGASIPLALNLFRKTVELDPAYSSAWAGLADAYTGLAITGSVSGVESKGEAMAAAKRSIALDPRAAAGHSALANATLLYENDRTRAGEEFERALELNPNYVLGRCWYALFYLQWARGELELGITEARRALDLDPMNSYLAMILGCCYCTAGRLAEAVETGRRAIQLDPESFVAHWALGVSLRMGGQFAEAVSILEKASAMSSRHVRALASLAAVFGAWGRRSEAARLFGELRERSGRSFVPATYLALAAEGAGQHEAALALAQQAGKDREPTFILHARYFPEFRAFHSDPRFAAILREMDATA